jgi:hypothetical protein
VKRVELACVGFAVMLHAGALVVARAFPPPTYPASGDLRPLELVEVELPESPPEQPSELRSGAALAPSLDRALDRALDRDPSAAPRELAPGRVVDPGAAGPVAPSTERGPGEIVTAPEPGSSGDPNDWSAPSTNDWAPPGIGPQGPLWAQPGMLAPSALAAAPAATAAPRAPRADRDVANKLLASDLRERDKKLGLQLPAAGSVASVVKGAVYAADVPSDARAAIQVTLGPGGRVTGVRVLSQSGGDAATWNAVAQSVKASLGGAKLALSGDWEKGATIVVNVQSKMQLPSGSAGGGGLDLSTTQSFDVGDIGAKARRVVYTTFSATPLD